MVKRDKLAFTVYFCYIYYHHLFSLISYMETQKHVFFIIELRVIDKYIFAGSLLAALLHSHTDEMLLSNQHTQYIVKPGIITESDKGIKFFSESTFLKNKEKKESWENVWDKECIQKSLSV